jgi:exopolysaccharide biosynthesis polyprenyl glycosylphosphotransferase
MRELSSQAVETRVMEGVSIADVRVAKRADALWPTRAAPGWRHALLRRLLACADLTAGMLASVALAVAGSGELGQMAWPLVFLPVWILVAKLLGLYDRDGRVLRHLTVDEAPQLVLWALLGTLVISILLELTPVGRPETSRAVVAGLVALVSVVSLRAFGRWLWRRLTPPERVVIIGTVSTAVAFRRKLELFPDVHMKIAAVHDLERLDAISQDPSSIAMYDRILFGPASFDDAQTRVVLGTARAAGLKLSIVPPCGVSLGSAVQLSHLGELPFLEYSTGDAPRSTLFLKRTFDIVVSSLALVLLAPVFALIALAIQIDSRGPVFFRQWRAGYLGRPFPMLKFRSMVSNAEELLPDLVALDELSEPVFKLRNDPRVTRVGRLLRRWSLDELSQLWNVLVGDMSLVGPRPEQVELVQRYSPEERMRLAVKPGLTGAMQVYGRGSLTLSERLAVERDYVDNLSFGRDLRIIGMTFAVVLGRRGAY